MKGGIFDDPIILFGMIVLIVAVVIAFHIFFKDFGEDILTFVKNLFTFG